MYDLHNKILLREKAQALEGFQIKGVGIVFDNRFDRNAFDSIVRGAGAPAAGAQIGGAPKSGAPGHRGIDIVSAVEIHANRPNDLKNMVHSVRNLVDVVMVSAMDVQVARAAAQMPEIDVLSHAFIDQTTARDAAENGVALEINLRDFLSLYGMKRASLISKINFNLGLARKYDLPLVITTGAHTIFDMRTPKQIMMLAEAIGFEHDEAKKAIFETPRKIVEANRKKRTGGQGARGLGGPESQGAQK